MNVEKPKKNQKDQPNIRSRCCMITIPNKCVKRIIEGISQTTPENTYPHGPKPV